MIEQALKVIASFKDDASAGIKKLQENLAGLKPLGDSKSADGIKRIDTEARNAARGGVQELANAFKNVVSVSSLSGGATNFAASIGEAATAAGASITSGLIAPLTAVAASATATAGVFKLSGESIKQSGEGVKQLTSVYRAYSEEINKAGRDARASALAQGLDAAARQKAADAARNTVLANKLFEESTNKIAASLKIMSDKSLQTTVNLKFLNQTLSSLPKIAGGFAVELLGVFSQLSAVVGGSFLLALEGVAFGVRNAADASGELADKLGLTNKELEVFTLLASENGTSAEALIRTYDRLAKSLDKASDDSKAASEGFAALGISQKEAASLSETELAGKIIKNYEALGKSTEATAAVQKLLGQNFREQIPAIKEAADNFDSYTGRVEKYGATVSKEVIEAGGRQEEAISNLGLAFKGLGIQIAEASGESITKLVQGLADLINGLRQSEIVAKTATIIYQTLAITFANVAFVFQSVGREIGGIAAQLARIAVLDFKGAAAIRGELIADAKAARAALDEYEKRILNPPKTEGDAELARLNRQAEEAKKREVELAAAREKAALIAKKIAEEQTKLFENAKLQLEQQLGLLGSTTELEKTLFEVQKGRYAKLSLQQKGELAGLAAAIDLKKEQIALDEKEKSIQAGLDDKAREITLAEEELKLAGLSAGEREKQVFLLKEMNALREDGKKLDDATLERLGAEIKVIANRKGALVEAQAAEAERGKIVADSEAVISASVQKNIQLAAQLLTARKISEADYVRYVEDQVKRVTDLNKNAAEEVSEFWKSAAQGIQSSLQSFFFDFMQGKLGSMVDGVKRAIDQVVSNFLAAQLAAQLFGNEIGKTGKVGGLVGQAGNFLSGVLGSVFGGARAEGGPIESGKTYLVGEKGPELRTFGAAGNITSNDKLQSLGKNVNVSFRVDAIDASSFRSKIDEFKREISAAVNDSNLSYGV